MRRLYFTLMELLLVIGILAAVAGFVGMNIAKAVREQRFRAEVAQVVDQLRLAQDLMLVFQGDVHFTLSLAEDGKAFSYGLKFDYDLPNYWKREIQQKQRKLTHIHFISMDPPVKSGDQDTLDLAFLSNGSVMSKGVLRLSTSESSDTLGALEQFIYLPGHPAPIFSRSTHNKSEVSPEKESSFNKQFTQRMIEEIRAQEATTTL